MSFRVLSSAADTPRRALAPALGSALFAMALLGAPAHASQLTISQTSSIVNSISTWGPGAAAQYFPNSGAGAVNILPFDSSLGTLDKVSIDWNLGGSFNVTNGSNGGGLGFVNWGGNAKVNGTIYNGGGVSGTGDGNGPYGSYSATQTNKLIHDDFFSNTGNPAIYNVLFGSSPYQVSFDVNSPYQWLSSNASVASGTASVYRNVTVTYLYTPAPPSAVPEIDPAGMGSVVALVTGALGVIERRRLKAKLAA